MVIIVSGEIRVSLLSEEGREITLFRLGEGNCCVTAASCVIRQITFDTVVTAVRDTKILAIPAQLCAYLSESDIYFSSFLFRTETERFSQVIWVLQELLFGRFDQRLSSYLLSQYEKDGKTDIKLTQEEIARDVNSKREVAAGMFRHFSSDGFVELKRGSVKLKDIGGLRKNFMILSFL